MVHKVVAVVTGKEPLKAIEVSMESDFCYEYDNLIMHLLQFVTRHHDATHEQELMLQELASTAQILGHP